MEYFNILKFPEYFLLILYFLSWDIIGFALVQKLANKNKFLRPIAWFFGLGVYSFIIFIIHFFKPYTSPLIYLLLLLITLAFLPNYIQNKGLKTFHSFVSSNLLILVVILPVIPILFVKFSLPPHAWDEMTYHFISPYTLTHQLKWKLGGGLYQNMPRFLDTIGIGLFASFKTYMPLRIVHASILVSTLFSLASFLKRYSSPLFAALFVSVVFLLGKKIPTLATLGYVDIASACFITLATTIGLVSLLHKKPNLTVVSFSLWGLALGTKYNSLLPFLIFLTLGLLYIFTNKNLYKPFIKPAIIGFVSSIIMGGYWYVKNQLLHGSLVYPFFPFGCKTDKCAEFLEKFKRTWQGTSASFEIISTQIFSKISLFPTSLLIIAILATIVIIWLNRKQRNIILSLGLGIVLTLDIIVSSQVFVYIARYYYHWFFIFLILIFLGLSSVLYPKKHKLTHLFTKLTSMIIIISILVSTSILTMRLFTTYKQPKFRNELDFSLGRLSLNEWLPTILPKTTSVIHWCNDREDTIRLSVLDPDIIWYKFEGRYAVFVQNCEIGQGPANGLPLDQAIEILKKDKAIVHTLSLSPCLPEPIEKGHPLEDESKLYMRQLNNKVVCSSTEILPNLYYFDWENVK